jgi:hypothetical protein
MEHIFFCCISVWQKAYRFIQLHSNVYGIYCQSPKGLVFIRKWFDEILQLKFKALNLLQYRFQIVFLKGNNSADDEYYVKGCASRKIQEEFSIGRM